MKVGTVQFALVVLVFSSLGAGQLAGQSVPRTADGHPDLQGVWDFRTMTPLQRPTDLSNQEFLTAEEASAQEAGVAQRRAQLLEPSEIRSNLYPAAGVAERSAATTTSGLITEPPSSMTGVHPSSSTRKTVACQR